jgi:Putative zincin peptidase
MFLIPRWLVDIITMPGVVIHELGHELFCRLFGVRVRKVVYFRFGNPAGFVEHDTPESLTQMFFISVGPLILNGAIALALAHDAFHLSGSSIAHTTVLTQRTLQIILIWLSVAIGANAIPSDHDASNLPAQSWKRIRSRFGFTIMGWFWLIIGYPFYWLISVMNFLRYFYSDFIFAGLLVYIGGFLIK